MQSSDPRLFGKAVTAFQTARYDDAERDFKKVLRGEPRHFGALNLYAILLMQTGRFGEAESLLRKATAVDSRSDATFYNLGLALKHLKKPADALDAFSKSIALKPNNAESWNNRGTVYNDLGRYVEAIQDFDQAIALNPTYAEAMSNRGRSLLLLEQYAESAAAYDQAIKINPHLPEAWMGRGTVLVQLKQWNDALSAHQTAITLRGTFQEAWVGIGNIQLELNRPAEAARSFETAITLRQNDATSWMGLANSFLALGKTEKALEASSNAVAIEPENPEIIAGHGSVLARLRLFDEALSTFDRILGEHPKMPKALIGRGNVLTKRKDHTEALACYNAVLETQASSAEARVGRGNVLTDLKRFTEALTEFDKAIEINPNLFEAWLGRSLALTQQKEFDAAKAAFRQTLDLHPNSAEALTGYGYLLGMTGQRNDAAFAYDRAVELDPTLAEAWVGRASILSELRRFDEAQDSFERSLKLRPDLPFAAGELLHVKFLNCDWDNREADRAACIAGIDRDLPVVGLFSSLTLGISSEQELRVANLIKKDVFRELPDSIWKGERYAHDKIRVAYLSADFRLHPVAYLTTGLFESHDRSRFETIALSVGPDDGSAIRSRLIAAFDHFVDGHNVPNRNLAAMIREQEVDILVDLGGHTADARIDLLAWRPAPVQATYLGYPGTTGLDFVNYLIADRTVIPDDQQKFYAERIAYLPDCYLPNDRTRPITPPPSKIDAGLPPSSFVFCSFNQPYKITPAIFDVWMRLLNQIPDSVLWLPTFEATARRNLQQETEQRGINRNRIIFADRTERQEDHLARLSLADLFLDTPGYNAHSTACDALWAGVPLITCIGSTFAGRVGASVLKAMGLPELVVTSLDDYEALALKLATEPALLASIKSKLAAQRLTAPLFDTERFTRNLEALYLKMWERAQAGEPPAPLSL